MSYALYRGILCCANHIADSVVESSIPFLPREVAKEMASEANCGCARELEHSVGG